MSAVKFASWGEQNHNYCRNFHTPRCHQVADPLGIADGMFFFCAGVGVPVLKMAASPRRPF